METHRNPAVAGMFYPANPDKLKRDIESYLSRAKKVSKRPVKFIIVPHAGYIYSGRIAGESFAEAAGTDYQQVILLGPSHRYSFRGLAESEDSFWRLPTGVARIRPIHHQHIIRDSRYHQNEHCLEVQMPFLIHLLPDAVFSPLLVSGSHKLASQLADSLLEQDTEQTLWVISSDFNHVGPSFRHIPQDFGYDNGEAMDLEAIDYITAGDITGLIGFLEKNQATICGAIPIVIAMHLIKKTNRPNFTFKTYHCSGKQTGDVDSVGYASLFS